MAPSYVGIDDSDTSVEQIRRFWKKRPEGLDFRRNGSNEDSKDRSHNNIFRRDEIRNQTLITRLATVAPSKQIAQCRPLLYMAPSAGSGDIDCKATGGKATGGS